MKIYIVGIGMDGASTLTQEADKIIREADVLIGAKRMLKPFEHLGRIMAELSASREIAQYIAQCEEENIAVLMSGDCGFYSGAKKLLPFLEGYETELICGISSPVYFCSKLKIDWEKLHFVSLHGRNDNIVRSVCSHERVFFLLGGKLTVADICSRLCRYGMHSIKVYIGENLSYSKEKIMCGKAEDFQEYSASGLSVMIAENPDYEQNPKSGISDDEFIRGKLPMTKSEVRTVAVAGLEIGKKDICWDIGSGTGSVAVEMAMQCENGTVFAVEKNPDGVKLIDKNRLKFGCDNIEIIEGEAVGVINELPSPDCVFIGGSGGQLREIIEAAYKKNPSVRLTVTAVSLETLSECSDLFEDYGFESEIIQLAVTRTRKAGSHTMLSAENPIFVIKRKFR